MNLKKGKAFLHIILVGALLGCFSCSEDIQKSLQPFPTALGKINQLNIIADQDIWDGPVGDTIRYYYSSAYPILPQPEPVYDLRHYTPRDLLTEPLRKELKNYILVANLGNEDSPTAKMIAKDLGNEKIQRAKNDPTYDSSIGRNKWASDQLLVYQFAFSNERLAENIKKNFLGVSKKLKEADLAQLDANVYQSGQDKELEAQVREKFGVNIRIPADYSLATSDEEVMWIRKDTRKANLNVMIKKVKYTDKKQLTKDGLKAIRDSLGSKYISSEIPGTYMRVNDVDLPLITTATQLNGKYAIQANGIWEIVNDFMGGAFVSYLILDEQKNELVFVDGFVHAPGEEKRNLIQYLDHIISSVKI